jgi:hypothetical protein
VDGVLYANFAWGSVEIGDLLGSFLSAMGVSEEVMPAELGERLALYRARSVGRRFLLVLEDVEHEEQVMPLIPLAPDSVVLITTRAALEQLAMVGAELLSLGPLDAPAARELLGHLIGRSRTRAEPDAVDELVRMSGGSPLAMQVCGRYLSSHEWPVSRLVGEILAGSDHPIAAGAEDEADLLFTGVYRTLNPSAAELYRRLALHPGPSFTPIVASVVAGVQSPSVHADLRELFAMQLIENVSGRSRFHQPLLRHARVALEADEPKAEQDAAAARIVDFYASAARRLGLTIEPERQLPALGPGGWLDEPPSWSEGDAMAWFDAERSNLLAVIHDAADRDWNGRAWTIGEALAPAFRRREHRSAEALEIYTLAATAARRLANPAAEARIRVYLAQTHMALADWGRAEHELDLAAALVRRLDDSSVEALVEEVAAPDIVLGADESFLSLEPSPGVSRLEVERYTASGGESALLRVSDRSALRVESHPESFALVWPATCALSDLAERVLVTADTEPEAHTTALVVDGNGSVAEAPLDEMLDRIAADDLEFARLELTDLVITWNRRADPVLSPGDGLVHEVGLGSESFNRELVRDLLTRTAVESISDSAEDIVEASCEILMNASALQMEESEMADGEEEAAGGEEVEGA